MAHFPVGHLRSRKSAVLPICHMLILDGVYLAAKAGPSFCRVKASSPAALELLVHTLCERIARHLERRGLLVRDDANGFLTLGPSDDATLDELRGHSIPYRIALGPHAGRKAFTLQTLSSTSELRSGRHGPMVSHCMQAFSPRAISATSLNACAGPSHGLR